MLLTGTYPRSLDEKQRIAIPKPLRDTLASASEGVLYVAPGTDGSLSLYPEEAFARLAERLAQASPNARQVRDYSRLFYARATRVELDRQGRVRLPQELIQLARLKREVVLLGVQDHLELWDKEEWEAYLEEKLTHYDEIAEAAFGGGPIEPAPPAEAPANRAPK